MSQASSLQSEAYDTLPDFVDLDGRYVCPLCGRVLQHAMQTACGHRLCQGCLADLLADATGDAMCPVNEEGCEVLNQGENKVFKDFCARREVKQLPVYCTFRKYGCKVTPAWSQLPEHEKKCEFLLVDCPFRSFGCGSTVPSNSLEKHIQNECEYRPRQCGRCHVQIPMAKMEDHIANDCLKVSVPCPHKCGSPDMPREKLEDHLKNCMGRPQSCKYQRMGCEFTGTTSEVAEHEQTALSQHLELLTMYIASMELSSIEARSQMQEIANERDIIQNQQRETMVENLRLKEVVEGFQKKLQDIQRTVAQQSLKITEHQRRLSSTADKDIVELHSSQLVAIQENQTEFNETLSQIRGGGYGLDECGNTGALNANIRTQLEQHDRQIGVHDVKMSDFELHFQLLDTASYDGTLIWKITDYPRRKRDAVTGKTLSLYSQPFYTSRHGYKMCARVYLNGDGIGKNTHMSFFFVVMRGDYDDLLPWPFKQKVSLMLMDVDTGRRHLSDTFRPDPTSSSFKKPTSNMNIASGCPLFVSQTNAESHTYKINETIYLKIVVDTSDLYGT